MKGPHPHIIFDGWLLFFMSVFHVLCVCLLYRLNTGVQRPLFKSFVFLTRGLESDMKVIIVEDASDAGAANKTSV